MKREPESIDLNADQSREAMLLHLEFQSRLKIDVTDPEFRISHIVSSYLAFLSISAEAANHGKSMPTKSKRKLLLNSYDACLGRPATADDLIAELSRYVAVPDFLADAIRKDLPRLR